MDSTILPKQKNLKTMEITKGSIVDLLDNLVKPMFDGIVKINVVDLSIFDDDNITTELYPLIDVTIEKEKYHSYDGYNKITKEVKSALKYFNIHHSIVDFYVISDI